MQILAATCEELKVYYALDWIKGNIKKLSTYSFSLPHMDWNTIKINSIYSFLKNINNEDMNFTYSNVMEYEKKFVVVKTNYGSNFTSLIKNNNILVFKLI